MTTSADAVPVSLRGSPAQWPQVLVVDDDSDMRSSLRINLATAGYCVALAEDSITARRLLRKSTPDLLIIGVEMPYRNGLDLVSHLLEGREAPRLPVVFVSSYGRFASTARVLGAGFLLKPFKKDELLATVARSVRPRSAALVGPPP